MTDHRKKKQRSHFEVREKHVFNFLIALPGTAWAKQVLQKTNLSVKARVLATNTEIVLVKEFLLPRDEQEELPGMEGCKTWKNDHHCVKKSPRMMSILLYIVYIYRCYICKVDNILYDM